MPTSTRAVMARLRELFRKRSASAAERDDELAFHLDMETAENVRRGMSDADARRAAILRFGGEQRYREEIDDARGVVALDNLLRDARFAMRRLRRAPAFSFGVIATLGIGIGAAVGIGTIVYDVLLRDLPYAKPGQLVRVGFVSDGIIGDLHAPVTYYHFVKGSRAFSDLAEYYTSDNFNVTDGDAPERVSIAMVSPNLFSMLGVRPVLGHLLEQADTSWSNPRAAILISESLWRRRYGADPSIIGRKIDINRGRRFVVGVLPASFDFPKAGIDIYYPAPVPVKTQQITARSLNVVGRLRDGVAAAGAESELRSLLATLPSRFPTITAEMLRHSHAHVIVQPLKAATIAPVRAQLVLLGVLVAFVLVVATTNVVNLFLLRAERSDQEIAIALSLGASRAAIAQRFVIEGIVLGVVSAVVALPAAGAALFTKFGFTEREIPRLHEVSFGWPAVALTLVAAIAIGAGVGLAALTRTQVTGLANRLRTTRATSDRRWRRMQDGLVAFQVAIALVLLVATALLGRSFWNLHNAKLGFDPSNAMTFQVSLPWGNDGYAGSYGAAAEFHAKAVDQLAALPGVTAAAAVTRLPISGKGTSTLDLDLRPGGDAQRPTISVRGNMASAGYFSTMGIPLLAGRTFRSGDLRGKPAVILSERLAKNLFGTTDVVGREVDEAIVGHDPLTFTIVGVVGDVPWERIEDGYTPMLYFPLLRDGDGIPPDVRVLPVSSATDVQYVVRGSIMPSAVVLQQIINGIDRRVPPMNIGTLDGLVGNATARVRLTMLLIATTGVAALLLGVVGVYSVVAYAANGRMREFGIRIALGAAPSRIGRLVLNDGARLVLIGVVVGLSAALATTRYLRALLYEVQPTGVAEFGGAVVLLVGVTFMATMLPARRAARTHPSVVLRGE